MVQRPVLDSFVASTLRQEDEDVFAWLLELSHPDTSEPYRISSDNTELYGYDDNGNPIYCTRRRGNPYFSMPFSFLAPAVPADGGSYSGKIVIGWNPDIMKALSNVHDRLTLSGWYVDVEDPNTAITTLPNMLITSVEITGSEISGELGIDHFLDEPCGRLKFLPSSAPALFKSGVTPTTGD